MPSSMVVPGRCPGLCYFAPSALCNRLGRWRSTNVAPSMWVAPRQSSCQTIAMKFEIRSFLTFIAAFCLTATATHAITLTKEGQAAATIVIRQSALAAKPYTPDYPNNIETAPPDAKVRLAANDLQSYIEKISGAKLPIAGEAEDIKGPVILVGVSKRTETLKLDVPHGVTKERKEEGYVLHCHGDTLVLAGNEDGQYWGTYYAVAEFLNRLGVRWFMPTEFGEIVPGQKTISFGN